jgi:hypothetical protein
LDKTVPLNPINCTPSVDEGGSPASDDVLALISATVSTFSLVDLLVADTSSVGGAVSWYGGVGGSVAEARRWSYGSGTSVALWRREREREILTP